MKELVLITGARDELIAKHGVSIHIIEKDLSVVRIAFEPYEQTKTRNLQITTLVNNAGFGVYGDFGDTDVDDELRMINVNISSVVALTKLFLQDMLVRKEGRIMNIA